MWFGRTMSLISSQVRTVLHTPSRTLRHKHVANSDNRIKNLVLRNMDIGPKDQEGIRPVQDKVLNLNTLTASTSTVKHERWKRSGGRDKATGRKILKKIGKGNRINIRHLTWFSYPKISDEPILRKIFSLHYDPARKCKIMLTGLKNKLSYEIATSDARPGTVKALMPSLSSGIAKPIEGNSYAIGNLPSGTNVCLIQIPEEKRVHYFREEEYGTIARRVGNKIVVRDPNKFERMFDENCSCVVGKVSTHELHQGPVGCPNRNRWRGIHPSSGLWHRKDGRFGRKIKKYPPIEDQYHPKKKEYKIVRLHSKKEVERGEVGGKKRKDVIFDMNMSI